MTLVRTPAARPAEEPREATPEPPPADDVPTAERAECTCPEFCERDHANE